MNFGNRLTRIQPASVCVAWKNQNRVVTSQRPADVLQRYLSDDPVLEDDSLHTWPVSEGLVIGEGGRILAQARILGGMLVADGERLHRSPGLHITLGRHLHLLAPAHGSGKKVPSLQISDTLASIAFHGPEILHNLYSTSRDPPAQSRHIRGTVVTWTITRAK
ncbi:hypothetical protein EDB92DRAFT_1127374 [Lactarius akahatsu]|uniref:Uncharacterized protein n=1 Tax=Lactarius akahatsu TaxID=416441 RepID=A0AAD4LD89_9AGAM|nr:hypothetical protein EDB92DRAFT_1127374 [Lactarius akahatsu]